MKMMVTKGEKIVVFFVIWMNQQLKRIGDQHGITKTFLYSHIYIHVQSCQVISDLEK